MKKLISVLLVFVFVLTACDEPVVEFDNYGYENLLEGHVVVDTEYKEIFDAIDADESFVLFVGRNSCPHCQDYLPLLSEALKDLDMEVTYLNYERYRDANGNLPSDLVSYFEQLGIQYVPVVYVYAKGEILTTFSTEVGSKAGIKEIVEKIK